MRLTDYSEYALRVLIYLGIQDNRLATIGEISKQYDISRNHLVKLVHDLGRNGFIKTFRGKNGGLSLGRDPALISVGEVVRAMEKDMAIAECFRPGDSTCRIVKSCALAGVIGRALDAFLGILDQCTIADLIKPEYQLARAFPIDVWGGNGAVTAKQD